MNLTYIENYNVDQVASRSEGLNLASDLVAIGDELRAVADKCYDTAKMIAIFAIMAFIGVAVVAATNSAVLLSKSIVLLNIHPLFWIAGVSVIQVFSLGMMAYYVSQRFKYMDKAIMVDQKAMVVNAKAAIMPNWKEPSYGYITGFLSRLFSTGNGVTNYQAKTVGGKKVHDNPFGTIQFRKYHW